MHPLLYIVVATSAYNTTALDRLFSLRKSRKPRCRKKIVTHCPRCRAWLRPPAAVLEERDVEIKIAHELPDPRTKRRCESEDDTMESHTSFARRILELPADAPTFHNRAKHALVASYFHANRYQQTKSHVCCQRESLRVAKHELSSYKMATRTQTQTQPRRMSVSSQHSNCMLFPKEQEQFRLMNQRGGNLCRDAFHGVLVDGPNREIAEYQPGYSGLQESSVTGTGNVPSGSKSEPKGRRRPRLGNRHRKKKDAEIMESIMFT